MTDTNTDAPPDGWVVCQDYPVPGDSILLWRPATSQFETSSWVPARVKDRRLRGLASRMVRPALGYGREFPVQHWPVHHYATPGDPVTPTDTNLSASNTSNTPNDPCVCGHSRRNHGKDNGRAVCFVCTHPAGGCRGGFTPDRPESTAAERDAFLAGFHAGADWAAWDGDSTKPRHDHAIATYHRWIEGPGEDA